MNAKMNQTGWPAGWTVLAAVLSLSLAMGVAYAGPTNTISQVSIQVKGLACPFCVLGLEKHLKKLDAVEAVTTDLKTGEAVVRLKPGQKVSEKALREAVKKAGFTAGKIRFDKKAASQTPDKSGGGG